MPAMEENSIKRIMPHSLEAEQSVIGSMFVSRDAILAASELISGEDFYNKQYGVIFDTMLEINDQGLPVDPVTLLDKLREKDVPPEVSDIGYIKDLLTAALPGTDYSSTYFSEYQVLCQYCGREVRAS